MDSALGRHFADFGDFRATADLKSSSTLKSPKNYKSPTAKQAKRCKAQPQQVSLVIPRILEEESGVSPSLRSIAEAFQPFSLSLRAVLAPRGNPQKHKGHTMPTPPHKQPHQTQWEKVKLGDIAEITAGQSPQSKFYSATQGMPFLQGSKTFGFKYPTIDTYTTHTTKIAKKGSILISVRAPVGDLNFAPFDICIGRGLASIEAKVGTNQSLWYILKFNLANILRQKNLGTTFDSISKETLQKMNIIAPPLPTQENIAQILSTLDKKIELNTRINAELESMAKLLYTRYFLEYNFPDSSGKPYKASGGAMVYSPTLKREIPKDWEVASLADNQLCTPISPKVDKFQGDKIYLPTSAIQGWDIVDFTTRTTYENRISRANMQPKADSVWFAKMKDTNKTLYFGDYSQSIHTLILSTGMCGLSCKQGALEYIWNFINSKYFNAIKNAFANGSTQKAINDENLDFIHLVIPSEEVLKDFHKATYNLYKQKYLNQQESQRLAEWRDYLLPLLMGDQVEVV